MYIVYKPTFYPQPCRLRGARDGEEQMAAEAAAGGSRCSLTVIDSYSQFGLRGRAPRGVMQPYSEITIVNSGLGAG